MFLVGFLGILQAAVSNLNINGGKHDLINITFPLNFGVEGQYSPPFEYFNYADDTNSSDIGYLYENGTSSGLLSLIPQTKFKLPNETEIMVPFLRKFDSMEAQSKDILAKETYLFENREQYMHDPNLKIILPNAAIYFRQFEHVDNVSLKTNVTIMVNDITPFEEIPNNIEQFRLISYLDNAFLRFMKVRILTSTALITLGEH